MNLSRHSSRVRFSVSRSGKSVRISVSFAMARIEGTDLRIETRKLTIKFQKSMVEIPKLKIY